MVLRPGAWESSAPPVFPSGPPASFRSRGAFFSRGAEAARLHAVSRGAEPARLHAAQYYAALRHASSLLARKHVSLQYIITYILGERKSFLRFGVL